MFSFNSTAGVLVAATLCVSSCGGSDGQREDQPIQDRMQQTQELSLKGCVQAGPLQTDFVLENAHREPAQAGDGGVFTEGSMVQLVAINESDLRPHVGKEVTVSGTITNTGENTIGTAGTQGHEVPSGDRSMAADKSKDFPEKERAEAGRIGRESMANGSAPTLRVAQIKPTGRSCGTEGQK
jgi:hypothetical protein